MNFTLRIWRQQSANASGRFVTYQVKDVTRDMSFLEMLDALNEDLLSQKAPPVAFEHDCREGICGSRSEEHTSELQSLTNLVCRLLLAKKQSWDYARLY